MHRPQGLRARRHGPFAGDLHVVEWAGVLVLLIGGLTEQFRLHRQQASLVPSAAYVNTAVALLR